MAGGDWFSQYIQSLKPQSNYTPPNMASGQPNNILNAMGQYPDPNATGAALGGLGAGTTATQQQTGPANFLQQLFNQLLQNSSNGYQMPSPADILKQATTTASAQYDPQINAIKRQMSQTQVRAGKNKTALKNLYGGAAAAYNGDIATAKTNNKAAVVDEKARQKSLQDSLKQDYSASMDEQMKQLQNLGIQSAAPQTTQQQRNDLDYLAKLNDTMGNANLSDLNAEGAGDLAYYNEGKGIDRLQGANAVNDLMTQLSDYLTQESGNVGTLQAQKQAAISTLQQQLTQQATKAQQDSQQGQWNNLYKLASLYNTIGKSQQQKPATNGLNAASQYLAGATTPQKAQDVMSALDMLLGQGFSTGRKDINGNPIYASSPEQAANVGTNYANKNGWGSADALNLMQAILAYYGKLGG